MDSLTKNKSLIIRKNEEWYILDGKVDKHRIINQWHDLVNQSIQSGKKGLRDFCMMDCFFENGFFKEVVDYECSLPLQFEIPFYSSYKRYVMSEFFAQSCHNHTHTINNTQDNS